jgi:hypothetical protein
LQILTLLWQSEGRGLQILNPENEWIFAPPIPGTFVVNIGDFLMRLTNDRLKSTVHRVKQNGKLDRYSFAFFFGMICTMAILAELIVTVPSRLQLQREVRSCSDLCERVDAGEVSAGHLWRGWSSADKHIGKVTLTSLAAHCQTSRRGAAIGDLNGPVTL